MGQSSVIFSPQFGLHQPKLFGRTTRDALADWLAKRFAGPGQRKRVAKAFPRISEDEARAACRGNPSWSAFDRMMDEGGWELWLEIGAQRFGENVASHLAREARRHAERSEAVAAMARAFRSGGSADPDAGLDDRAERAGGLAALDRRAAERGVRRSP